MSGNRTETNLTFLIVLTLVAVCVGGMIEIVARILGRPTPPPPIISMACPAC